MFAEVLLGGRAENVGGEVQQVEVGRPGGVELSGLLIEFAESVARAVFETKQLEKI